MNLRFLRASVSVLGVLLLACSSALPDQGAKGRKVPSYAIQVEQVDSSAVKLPAEFGVALYENLIDEIRKTESFLNVFRSGDRGAEEFPELVVLHTKVEGFKEGSQRKREVTTVAGATSLKVRVEVTGRDGHLMLDREVEGKVRFFGDNLRATYNLSRSVAKIFRQTS